MTEPRPQKSPIDAWANFLAHEKLHPQNIKEEWVPVLIYLAEKLAEKGSHKAFRSYKDRLLTRRQVCETAIDEAIDLIEIETHKGKVAIGRGLLDMWQKVLTERFGSTIGTNAEYEARRRDVKTRLYKRGIKGVPNWKQS